MKPLPLILCLSVLLMACSKNGEGNEPEPVPEPEPEPVFVDYTLMTYNVGAFRKYEADLGHLSYPEVASIITSVDADICGMNETDWLYSRTYSDKQAQKLAGILGSDWESHFIQAYRTDYGNSMVWKKKLNMIYKFPRVVIPRTGEGEMRSMGAIEFEDFVFCTTHLDHKSNDDRLTGVKLITDWAAKEFGNESKPVFLAGDLNCEKGSDPINELQKNWKQLSVDAKSYPSDKPRKSIDYIFVYSNDQAERVSVVDGGVITKEDNPTIAVASDHCPVWVKIKIQK